MPETAAPPDPKTVLYERIRRITVDEFFQMAEIGIFADDERVELIHGEVLTMSPAGPPHLMCVNNLTDRLARHLYGGDRETGRLSVQNPIRLGETSAPEPDVCVLSPDTPRTRVPEAKDVLLLIEVAESSLEYDRGPKLQVYAAAKIPVYWIVDLVNDYVDVFTLPKEGTYTERHRFLRGDAVPLPETILCEPIAVGNILGAQDADAQTDA
jgi:Uma2 family endonuclease